ncbi:hypothetical protein PV04_05889 [Phialophora macrospora]|uniref:Uncharacterized protein n=1 Tax=Phialophora macrospora TaxID=1851006 RepID=A0A0D2G3C9_9EURO|nr:hypothetical protein PV04_05889 [Phialophora macrospora]
MNQSSPHSNHNHYEVLLRSWRARYRPRSQLPRSHVRWLQNVAHADSRIPQTTPHQRRPVQVIWWGPGIYVFSSRAQLCKERARGSQQQRGHRDRIRVLSWVIYLCTPLCHVHNARSGR